MKTSVIMHRNMGDFTVFQRTKDGFFNATVLLHQWNNLDGKADLRISKFLNQEKTKQFIESLKEDLQGAEQPKPVNQVVKKSNAKTNPNGKRVAGAYWMHPYLFIKFAMWLNPKFEIKVIKFVYDQLIEFRDMAGDLYKGLTKSVARLDSVNYSQLAKGLNYIVFGRHEQGIRQQATKEELKRMNELQMKLAFAIDMNYINSFEELLSEMRRLFNLSQFNCIE